MDPSDASALRIRFLQPPESPTFLRRRHYGDRLLAPDGRLMAVAAQPGGGSFAAGNPARVLERAYASPGPGRTYDVSPDGRRFLMIKAGATDEDYAAPELVVVLNWFEELERLVPTGR